MSRKPLAFQVPKDLYRLPSHCWRDDAIALGLGRTVMVEVAEADKRVPSGTRKVMRARKLYTREELDQIRTRRAERKQRALEANGGSYRVRDPHRAQRRAEESAAQLVAEGEDPRVAMAWARTVYGLQDRAPARNPRLSPELRKALLEEAATARHSERLPSVEGRTTGATGARR